jgi:hypothetical protein
MSEPAVYASVNGRPTSLVRVTVGYVGPWTAEVALPDAAPLGVPTTVRIGGLTLVGTPLAGQDGTYAEQRKARIVGGAAAWSRDVERRGYHNDAGVKASLVAADLARELGETLGEFVPRVERVGVDWVREAGSGSTALDAVVGGVAWYVDYDGVTRVGARPAHTPDPGSYTVLSYDPAANTATLTADDPGVVRVGSTLAQGLDQPGTVRELEIVAGGEDKLRVNVWLGGAAQAPGRLAGLFTAIARRATDDRLYGAYRYRVVSQATDDRVDLQAVDVELGLPDLRAITLWPGVSGVRIRIGLGELVLVVFAEGYRSRPLVVSYAPGVAPLGLVVGGTEGEPAARKGDVVACAPVLGAAPPATAQTITLAGAGQGVGTYTFTFGPVAVPGSPTPANVLLGKIVEGSSIVSIAPPTPVATELDT